MKIKELVTLWINDKKLYVKKSTYSAYILLLENHILPFFGDRESIEEKDVQSFVFKKFNDGLSLKSVKDSYDLTQNDAERLYQHLWVYTHGIAALIATKMCAFTLEETGKMLTEVRISVLNQIKGGCIG